MTCRVRHTLLVGWAVLVASVVLASSSSAAVAPHLVGTFPALAVTDRQASIVVGTGPSTAVLRDGSNALVTMPLPAGCFPLFAAAATALIECGDGSSLPSLLNLKTGTIRGVPGADTLAGTPPYGGQDTYAWMGTQWLAGGHCGNQCTPFELNWHTGAIKSVEHPNTPLWTNLDSPTLSPDSGAARLEYSSRGVMFRRGKVSKRMTANCACGDYLVIGNRVAWLSAGGLINRDKPFRVLHAVNVKTGKKATINLNRFPGYARARAAQTPDLAATRGRLVVSAASAATSVTISTIRWPV